MTKSSRKSKRRKQVKRRREKLAAARVKRPELLEFPSARDGVTSEAGLRVGISAFAVACGLAIAEGHAELPGAFYDEPRPITRMTAVAPTSGHTEINLWQLLKPGIKAPNIK